MAPETSPPSPVGDPPGQPALGDAFERLGILEMLSYGVLYDGRVYRASRSEPLALLELDPGFAADRDNRGRLVDEITRASKMRDPNVLAPRGLYRSGESLYVLWEALSGMSLATAFQVLAISGLRLSAEAILRVAGAVLAALDAASSGEEGFNCHGFLTPENIFVAEGQRVLVRGFGIWAGGAGRLKLAGPNEARYLTPSQNRAEAASPRADLFALGTILFEAIAGVPAFDGPPDEEAVISLCDTVEELQRQGGPSLQALHGVVLSCLTANPPIPAFRSRLRRTVDTLFLSELSHDRVAKTLSLEELIGKIRPRRPAVIKARSLALIRAEGLLEEAPPAAPAAKPIEPSSEASGGGVASEETELEQIATTPERPVVFSKATARSPTAGGSSSFKIWAMVGVAVVGAILGAMALRSRPQVLRMNRPITEVLPSPAAADSQAWPPAALPTAAVVPPTAPAPVELSPARDLRAPPTQARIQRPSRETSATPRKRPAPATSLSRRRESADRVNPAPAVPPPPKAGGGAVPQAAEPQPAPVAAGSLVTLDTPGLVRPVLTKAGDVPRFGSSDPRPAVEHSVLLQILVDDRGRVRANRVLRAERIPPGFGQGVEQYLATLRFQPAEVGGVPVRVWMPYELRFVSP